MAGRSASGEALSCAQYSCVLPETKCLKRAQATQRSFGGPEELPLASTRQISKCLADRFNVTTIKLWIGQEHRNQLSAFVFDADQAAPLNRLGQMLRRPARQP